MRRTLNRIAEVLLDGAGSEQELRRVLVTIAISLPAAWFAVACFMALEPGL